MNGKQVKTIALLISLLCIFCFPVQVSAQGKQGTDGDELKLIEPEQLEIQLGADWAGVEFQLKTDAGLYPGAVVVGEDGVLRLEIGGSTQYQLTCLNSTVPVPKPDDVESTKETTQAPATGEYEKSEIEDAALYEKDEQADTALGIPIKHLFMFGGGMLISISILIIMQVKKQKRNGNFAYEDDDDE